MPTFGGSEGFACAASEGLHGCLARALARVPQPVLVVSVPDLHLAYANEAQLNVFTSLGVEEPTSLVGSAFWGAAEPWRRALSPLCEVAQGDRAGLTLERYGMPGADGEEVLWDLSLVPEPDASGSRVAWVSITLERVHGRSDSAAPNDLARVGDGALALALQGTGITLWEQDADLRYVWVLNPRGPFTTASASAQSTGERLLSPGAAEMVALGHSVLATSRPQQGEMPLAVEGGTLHLAYRLEPLRDEQGRTVGILGAASDVTQWRQTEQALRESEQREHARAEELQAVMDAVPAAIWIARDTECRRIDGNRLGSELLRLPRAANLSVTAPPAERPTHFVPMRDGRVLTEKDLPVQSAARGETLRDTEFSLHFEDGTIRHLFGSASPLLDGDGQPRGAVAAFIDVTDRKVANEARARSEARLRRLVDSGLIGVVFSDGLGGIHDANDAFLELVGYSRAELDAGLLRWDALTPPELLYLDHQAIEEARLRRTCTPYEKEYIHRDGHHIPVLVGFTQLTDTGMDNIAFILDLTGRKRMERALEESHRTLQALMEYVPVGIFITEGASSRLKYASRQGRLMAGLPEGQGQPLDGARFAPGWRILSSDGSTPVPEEELPLTRAALRGESLSGQELILERADGGRTNVIASARPIRDEAGRVVAGIASWQDVGPLKQAQSRLEAALRRERFVTDLLQRALLPGRIASFQGYEASAAYIPANDEHLVGGDLYDLFPAANGQIGIILGDVSGKGVEATALAAATRSTLRAFLCEDPSPGTAMTRGNAVLCPQFEQTEAFVTVFLGVLDPSTGRLRYASAGHCPAFLQRFHGEILLTEPLDVMLGTLPEAAFGEGEVHLEPGDRLVLYTDGLEDARRGAGLFGPEGISAALGDHHGCSADACVKALLGASMDYAGGRLSDDTAVLVLQRESGKGASRSDRRCRSAAPRRSGSEE